MKVRYIDNDGEKRNGEFELMELDNGLLKLLFNYHLGQECSESDNYFSALQGIRQALEEEGITILCNGSSTNVYPSGMMLDMGNGEKAYRMREGFHATLNDIVNIFEFDEKEFVRGTVQDQEEYFNTWRSSKKRRRYSKPKYSIKSINPESTYIYFWGHQPTKDGSIGKSCLSQWWPCHFEKEGINYNSSEQWMMAEKARAFLDTEVLSKILKSKTPKEAKDLGRQVNNFSEDVWKLKSYSIVLEGNLLKFDQNPELKEYLLGTGDSIFVEASPYDKIWGIGMKQDDEGIDNPRNWKGKNLLGFALMEVRDILKEQDQPA
jgi:hypothetical protein